MVKKMMMAVALLAVGSFASAQLVLDYPAPSPNYLTGSGAPAGAPVELFVSGVSAATAVADGSGNFTFTGLNLDSNTDTAHVRVAQGWSFNDNTKMGWDALTTNSVTNGVLSVEADGTGNVTVFLNGNPAAIAPLLTRVMEIRYRVTTAGTPAGGILISTATAGFAFGQNINLTSTNGAWRTLLFDLSVDGTGAGASIWTNGEVNTQVGFAQNGFNPGDILEIDSISLLQGFEWEFNNDFDWMGWDQGAAVNIGGWTVENGKLQLTPSAANVGIEHPFAWLDSDYFTQFHAGIESNTAAAPQFSQYAWVDAGGAEGYYNGLGGGTTANFARVLIDTSVGGVVSYVLDLLTHTDPGGLEPPSWGPDGTSQAIQFIPGGNAGAGDTLNVDYVRLVPAGYVAPSPVYLNVPVELSGFEVE